MGEATEEQRDEFRAGYVQAMLWANTYDDATGEPVDAAYAYIAPGKWWEDTPVPLEDADAFLDANYDTLKRVHGSFGDDFRDSDHWSQDGQDFAFTRNGHGTGFWDRGYGDVGEALSTAARAYGEATVWVEWDA